MCVIDWNTTCVNPIECTRKGSKEREGATPASISLDASYGRGTPLAILPRRRVVCPASPEHRRDDIHVCNVIRLVRIAVEDDEVGEVARDQLPAAMLVAREPCGIHGRGHKGLVQCQALLRVPGT